MTLTESTTVPVRKKAFKVRLYPNAVQRELINKTVGCARFVYNHYLALRTSTYRETGRGMTYSESDKHLTTLKKAEETSWLAEVDKFALQQALRDLDKAYVISAWGISGELREPEVRPGRRADAGGVVSQSRRCS